jgi:hypothetical protein
MWTRVAKPLAILAALALNACDGAPWGGPPRPPERIFLIVIDTLRRDHVSGPASPVATPHIDALVRRGQLLEGAVASYHQTSSSMASLFTGRTPSLEAADGQASIEWTGQTWCGMRRFAASADEEACIPASLPTLAEAIRARGYWTAGVASNALMFRPAGFDRGFDAWLEVGGEEELARGADATRRAVEELLARRRDDRFFLYVHYMDVHDYERQGRGYAESVALVDRAIGDLVERLERERLLEDAVLVLTSDHGERLPNDRHVIRGKTGHYGDPSFEEVLRVPVILVPRLIEGTTPEALRGDDVHRLLRRIAGVEDLGERDLEPGELFVSELSYQTYRRGRFKSYRRRDGDLVLVDLASDAGERRDVASLHPEVAKGHAARLDELSRRLAVESNRPTRLSERDRSRLRSLGYLE